jgi:hypothetical protein
MWSVVYIVSEAYWMKKLCLCLPVFLLLPAGPIRPQVNKDEGQSTCELRRSGDQFIGSCGSLFDQTPVVTLQSVRAITTGTWRSDMKPVSVWSGDMTDRGYPNAPLELEIYEGNWGVLRTEYGWFRVSDFVANQTLRFRLDSTREIKPSTLDLAVVARAAQILSAEAAWNRADNRKCPVNATQWSIYCALEKAEIEVTGGFHHRRPAAEIVRKIVDERARKRDYHHLLMEYNNDPRTHLRDVQTLFEQAEGEIRNSH